MHRALEACQGLFHLSEFAIHTFNGGAELADYGFPLLVRALSDVDREVFERHGQSYLSFRGACDSFEGAVTRMAYALHVKTFDIAHVEGKKNMLA